MITAIWLSVFLHFKAEAVVLKKCCDLDNNVIVETNIDSIRCDKLPNINNDNYTWFPKHILFTPDLKLFTEEERDKAMDWLTENVQTGTYSFRCKRPLMSIVYQDRHLFRILADHTNKVANILLSPSFNEEDVIFDNNDETSKLEIGDVCFDTANIDGIFNGPTILYCPGYSTPWIYKCCPPKTLYNISSKKCDNFPENGRIFTDWKPLNTSGQLGKHFLALPEDRATPCPNVNALYEKSLNTRCRGFSMPEPEMNFVGNGSVIAGNRMLHTEEYCGDVTWSAGGNIIEQNLLYCSKERTVGSVEAVYGALFIIGGFCLFVTVVISLILPELRQKIHNKIAITHNVALTLANMFWGSTMLLTGDVPIPVCSFLCFAIQIFFLGSLFWMNAMCINMSATFRTTQVISAQSGRSEMRKYGIYSLYAWGLPILIAVITAIMEFVEEPPWGLPRPGFTCFCDFDRDSFSVFVYLYGPMVVILIFNLVLYIFTVLKIVGVVRESKKVIGSNTTGGSHQSDVQMLILYTKLFFLMGITWMTEIIGWAIGGKTNNNAFIIFLDIVNLLRAVFIFILFVYKPQVIRKIRRYFQAVTDQLPRNINSTFWPDTTLVSTFPNRSTIGQQENVTAKRTTNQPIDMKSFSSGKVNEAVILEEDFTEVSNNLDTFKNDNNSTNKA